LRSFWTTPSSVVPSSRPTDDRAQNATGSAQRASRRFQLSLCSPQLGRQGAGLPFGLTLCVNKIGNVGVCGFAVWIGAHKRD
jgi:hypothetical protein